MMRRFAVTLAVLAVVAAACGTAGEPAATPAPHEEEQQAQPTPTQDESPEPPPVHPDPENDGTDVAAGVAEPEDVIDAADVEEPSEVVAALALPPPDSREQPPEFAPGQTSQAYLEELVTWTLADAEMGVSEEAAQADRAFTVCVAESFVAAFDADRRDELALTLSQQEDLWYGFPYDLLTPAEMERWTTAAHPCFEVSIDYATGGTSLLHEMVEMMLPEMQDPEDRVRMEASALECLRALAGDEGFTATTLQNLVFDMSSLGMEEELTLALFDLCGESLMVPILVESLVADEGMRRSVAECAAPTMLDMAHYELSMYAPGEQPPEDDQVETMFEFFAVLAECGFDTENMFGIPSDPSPVQVSDVAVEGEPLAPLEDQEPDPAIGQRAPAFAATTFDGAEVTVLPGDGTAKLVVFLAHWCPHCQRELPRIAGWLTSNQLPADVEVIAVSTAVDPTGANYPPSVWFTEAQWPAVVVRDSETNEIAQAYGLRTYPYTVAISNDGSVVARVSGALSDDAWAALLQFVAPSAD